jgi:hypothetical protein
MIRATISDSYAVLTVTVTTSATLLRNLINTALDGLSKTMPEGSIIQVILTPAAAITIQDVLLGAEVALAASTEKVLPIANILDGVKLKCSTDTVLCVVELYLASK